MTPDTPKWTAEELESYATAMTRARRWAGMLGGSQALHDRLTREIDKTDKLLAEAKKDVP
jgi:hypothetical protein